MEAEAAAYQSQVTHLEEGIWSREGRLAELIKANRQLKGRETQLSEAISNLQSSFPIQADFAA